MVEFQPRKMEVRGETREFPTYFVEIIGEWVEFLAFQREHLGISDGPLIAHV